MKITDLAARIADRLRCEARLAAPQLAPIAMVLIVDDDDELSPVDPTDPIDQRALQIAFTCLATVVRPSRAGRPRADKAVRGDFAAFAARYDWALPARVLEAAERRARKAAMIQAKRATRTEVACLLGFTYWELRGSHPSARRRQSSPFRRLVADVFEIASMAGADNAAEHACRTKKWAQINTYLPDRQ